MYEHGDYEQFCVLLRSVQPSEIEKREIDLSGNAKCGGLISINHNKIEEKEL